MKTVHLFLILISGIFFASCATEPPKPTCLVEGPIYTNEDDGIRFIAKSLLEQLETKSSEKKTLYISKLRDYESGKIIKATKKIRAQSTFVFSHSEKISVLHRIGDKQADYIVQGTLFLEHLPACFWKDSTTNSEKKYVLRVAVLDFKERVVKATAHALFSSFDSTPISRQQEQIISTVESKPVKTSVVVSQSNLGDVVSEEYISTVTIGQLLDEGDAFRAEGLLKEAIESYDKATQKAQDMGRKNEDMIEVCEARHQTRYLMFEQAETESDKELHLEKASQCLSRQLIAQIGDIGKIEAPIKFKTNTARFVKKHKGGLLIQAIADYLEDSVEDSREPPCIMIVGHTSCSGEAKRNCKLSRERAEDVEKRVINFYFGGKEAAAKRLVSRGRSFLEAINGGHNDNDPKVATDRRVEFKIVPCKKLDNAEVNFPKCEEIYERIEAGTEPKDNWDKCHPSRF